MRYTPSGLPILEFTLAVPQKHFEKDSIGYFESVIYGQAAEDYSTKIRVGLTLGIRGTLWMRAFKNRQGNRIIETKIVVEKLEGEKHEEI